MFSKHCFRLSNGLFDWLIKQQRSDDIISFEYNISKMCEEVCADVLFGS